MFGDDEVNFGTGASGGGTALGHMGNDKLWDNGDPWKHAGPGKGDSYYGWWKPTNEADGVSYDDQYAGRWKAFEDPNSLENRRRVRMMEHADSAVGFAGESLGRIRAGDSAAQHQMWSGLGNAQQAMRQQAVGRGANPLGQRAAMYAGGDMMQRGVGQAAALRAQEMSAAEGRYMDALRQKMAAEQFTQQLGQQSATTAEQQRMQKEAFEYAKSQDELEYMTNLVGAGASTLGSMAAGALG